MKRHLLISISLLIILTFNLIFLLIFHLILLLHQNDENKELIGYMEQAKASHQALIDDPEIIEMFNKSGFRETNIEEQQNWVDIYESVINALK